MDPAMQQEQTSRLPSDPATVTWWESCKAWAQLVRIPNTFTSSADVLAGMCIGGLNTHSFLQYPLAGAIAALGSIALYWGGMALNDVMDLKEDRANNRPGPIVRGALTLRQAQIATGILFFAGILLASLAGWLVQGQWQTAFVVAIALVLAIFGYDAWFKTTPIAPMLMGACRSLNLFLGVAIARTETLASLPTDAWGIPVAFGLYVMGFTIAARKEFLSEQSRTRLASGWAVSALGIASISALLWHYPTPSLQRLISLRGPWSRWFFPALFWILALPVARRAWVAYQSLKGPDLGAAIRQAILQILFIDAVIALVYAGSFAGLLIASLVIPSLFLSRTFRST